MKSENVSLLCLPEAIFVLLFKRQPLLNVILFEGVFTYVNKSGFLSIA